MRQYAMSYNDKIIKTLEGYGEWLPSFKLMNADTPYGWIGKSGDRRCRELAEKGIIERRLNGMSNIELPNKNRNSLHNSK